MNENACSDEVTPQIIVEAFKQYPNSLFLTSTKKCSKIVNDSIISFPFSKSPSLGTVHDGLYESQPIYQDMKICLTETSNKLHNIVNGQSCVIISFQDDIIFIQMPDDSTHFIHGRRSDEDIIYYPFLSDYSTTIFKAQGKNLKEVTVWLQENFTPPGQAYVAFSRVPKFANIHILHLVKSSQLVPIKYATPLEDQ